jgi:hypothetical protein
LKPFFGGVFFCAKIGEAMLVAANKVNVLCTNLRRSMFENYFVK